MKTEMANLHCECQELKPKAETNSSFLVLQPSSRVHVHTVNTVGSHLKKKNFAIYVIKRETKVQDNFFIQLQGGFC